MNQQNNKVLYVVNDVDFFMSHRLSLAQELKQQFDVHLVLPHSPKLDDIRRLGFVVHAVNLDRRSINPFKDIITFLRFLSLYRREKPAIVHHFTIKPIIYGSIAARLSGVGKVINTITGLGYVFIGHSFGQRFLRHFVLEMYRLALRGPNVTTLFQNPDDIVLFRNLNVVTKEQSVLILGSGVDTNKYLPQPEPDGPVRVLLPARMLKDKGVIEFADAARLLMDTKAEFCLVGRLDPNNPASLSERELRQLEKHSNNLKWLGYQQDMQTIYSQCHIVCLPSYREGLPMSLLEASACSKPIVATDVPGCRTVVVDGETGLLVESKNSADLAHHLRLLIENPAMRQSMGRAGRNYVTKYFDVKSINQQILSLYAG